MNKQKKPGGIEWTRVWGRDGYTWNPVTGCKHGCRWHMNGATAICYAEAIANHFTNAYPKGFEHIEFHPKRLSEPSKVKKPAGVFLDSMSDLMGIGVKSNWIHQVLDVCRENSHHVFFLLTKNAPRLLQFQFPNNVWVGVSSSPDILFGKDMDGNRKQRYMIKALDVLSKVDANVKWMSLEPLNGNYSEVLREYSGVLNWATVGAASNGRKYYPPLREHYYPTMSELDRQKIPVFFKGNMRSFGITKNDWTEEYPVRYM